MRRLGPLVLVLLALAGVVGYQVSTPQRAGGDPRVFVPSAQFYLDFSPSFRTTVADAYWLLTVQYYGEHLESDRRFDSLPAMLDLVTRLSPRFTKAYLFGAFALLDADEGQRAYRLLERGWKHNPDSWQIAATAGMLVYQFASNADKDRIAAGWYEKAAVVPGRPGYIPRLAAALLARGGETEKATLMWAQVYAEGDEYAQAKAVAALDQLLPRDRSQRAGQLEELASMMTPDRYLSLSAALLET